MAEPIYILKRGDDAWSGTAKSIWASEAVQVRRLRHCTMDFEEFKRRLDDGETLVFYGVTVFRHSPEDMEILDAVRKTAEHIKGFYDAMENENAE